MMDTLGIGAFLKATGVTIETIRWYEKLGLLQAPARTASNYRSYGKRHLGRLSIRRARDLGFTLDHVRNLLRLADQQDQSCEDIDVIAREHLGEVERKIADLERLRRELADIIGRCGHGTVAECRILDALSPVSGRRLVIALVVNPLADVGETAGCFAFCAWLPSRSC